MLVWADPAVKVKVQKSHDSVCCDGCALWLRVLYETRACIATSIVRLFGAEPDCTSPGGLVQMKLRRPPEQRWNHQQMPCLVLDDERNSSPQSRPNPPIVMI